MARLGDLLIEKGVLTPSQLDEALEAQSRLVSQGLEKLLGDLLIAKGYVTPDEIRKVLEAQQKLVVVCGACRVQFNVGGTDQGKIVDCPRCARRVQVPTQLSDYNMARPVDPTYIDTGNAPLAYLVVKNFHIEDAIYALRSGDDVVLGASPECTIRVEGAGVEAVHCRVRINLEDVLLTDLSKSEGTFVNGRRVSSCTLKFGDLILLGRSPVMVTPGLPSGLHDRGPREALLDADPASLVGTTVDKYRFMRVLGSGGMAVVMMAEQMPLGRLVAVKVLRREMLPNRKAVDRFLREALVGARLNHTNIVQTYDAGTMGGLLFIAMEYIEGEDVSQWIKKFGKLPVSLALSVSIQTAVGLAFAHEKGVIHRDVKPSNLMFAKEGRVKILDLGIAKVLHEEAPEKSKMGLGTLVYMPPEQTRDASTVDERADIYSLGATLYKMVTGNAPFKYKSVEEMIQAIRREPLPDPRLHVPELPSALVGVLNKAMSKDPGARYQSMKEFQDSLVVVWNQVGSETPKS